MSLDLMVPNGWPFERVAIPEIPLKGSWRIVSPLHFKLWSSKRLPMSMENANEFVDWQWVSWCFSWELQQHCRWASPTDHFGLGNSSSKIAIEILPAGRPSGFLSLCFHSVHKQKLAELLSRRNFRHHRDGHWLAVFIKQKTTFLCKSNG